MFKSRKSSSKSDWKVVKTSIFDLDELLSATIKKRNIFARIYWFFREKIDIIYYGYIVNKRPWIVKTSLEPSAHYDENRVLLYAIMAVFERFFNNEMKDKVDLDYDEWSGNEPEEVYEREKERFLHFCKELKEIHEWWSKYEDRYNQIRSTAGGKDYFDKLDQLKVEEQEILHRIINIRSQMWT